MNEEVRRALQIETEFLAGVESNFEQAKGRQLRGTTWHTVRADEEAALRTLLETHHRCDPGALRQLPHNRRLALHGYEPRWWLGKRPTGVAVASVLAPLEHLAAGDEGKMRPVELGDLVDHVRALVTDPELPHVIGVCSPNGFTPEARDSQLELPNVTLVLIEPGETGEWRVTGVSDDASAQVRAMFDPEATSRKLERVRDEIERRGADLLMVGLNADSMAARLNLPPAVVAEAFEQAAMAEPELKVTRASGETVLIRGAPVTTRAKAAVGVIDRIRALFDRDGDEAAKINLLTERRADLAQRRERIYAAVAKLEEQEAEWLDEGRRTSSASTRRRLAGQIAQLRKELARQNTLVGMFNAQIEILSTDVHNLTLVLHGQMTELPDAAELTENAVRAEEMLESFKDDAELARDLQTGIGEVVTSDEEQAILKEFDPPVEAEPLSEPAALEGSEAEPDEVAAPEPDEHGRRSAEPEA